MQHSFQSRSLPVKIPRRHLDTIDKEYEEYCQQQLWSMSQRIHSSSMRSLFDESRSSPENGGTLVDLEPVDSDDTPHLIFGME